ncbi:MULTISPECIES: hypothetical protein [unclassified Paraburkholderia]|uniref:hypothetical protein n=1 Tax=unclassified Paraburkholderia TaxID=2615204 RepID=UPI0016186273|nr:MULTISPECIES: hypothetical protein [unclassified Paraburkholderia]MBB5446082.1 hypothetical protein [Paraburkholderia sp. WSM4177]MBB5486487.1 hypothetical protein [Paraburkholderia sp. WSM4180]
MKTGSVNEDGTFENQTVLADDNTRTELCRRTDIRSKPIALLSGSFGDLGAHYVLPCMLQRNEYLILMWRMALRQCLERHERQIAMFVLRNETLMCRTYNPVSAPLESQIFSR